MIADLAAVFGGGIDTYLDWPAEQVIEWHPQALRHFELRAQSAAAAIATLFAKRS